MAIASLSLFPIFCVLLSFFATWSKVWYFSLHCLHDLLLGSVSCPETVEASLFDLSDANVNHDLNCSHHASMWFKEQTGFSTVTKATVLERNSRDDGLNFEAAAGSDRILARDLHHCSMNFCKFLRDSSPIQIGRAPLPAFNCSRM